MRKKRKKQVKKIEASKKELEDILNRLQQADIDKADKELLVAAMKFLVDLKGAHDGDDWKTIEKTIQQIRDSKAE